MYLYLLMFLPMTANSPIHTICMYIMYVGPPTILFQIFISQVMPRVCLSDETWALWQMSNIIKWCVGKASVTHNVFYKHLPYMDIVCVSLWLWILPWHAKPIVSLLILFKLYKHILLHWVSGELVGGWCVAQASLLCQCPCTNHSNINPTDFWAGHLS